ncbi:MAG: helix-turn-helix domain-containing protein [Gracilibacteraceae bacterium]|nr:helix-turn-helix domain-containing protein [Gracilibacteraceae bacterium]
MSERGSEIPFSWLMELSEYPFAKQYSWMQDRCIKMSTLDKLCEALDCQPGDILEYEKKSGI